MVQTFMDHRVSPVPPQGDRCPWLQVVQVLFPVDAQRRLPMVQTTEIPQFVDTMVDFPVVRVVQILRCCRGEDSRAPTVALVLKLVACSSEPRWFFFRALYRAHSCWVAGKLRRSAVAPLRGGVELKGAF